MGAAIVGIFLGVAGLVFGIVSKNKADQLRRDFSQVQELVEKIQRVEDNSTGISASATRLSREVESLRQGTQDVLDKVSTELGRFRADLNSNIVTARSLEEKLADLEQMRAAPAPEPVQTQTLVADAGTAQGPVQSAGGDAEAEEEAWHAIQPGDTLSRVAANHNVPLDLLMAANPSVDPLRLQIGQRIRLPSR